MMKKLICVITVLSMVAALAGCANNNNSGSSEASSYPSTSASDTSASDTSASDTASSEPESSVPDEQPEESNTASDAADDGANADANDGAAEEDVIEYQQAEDRKSAKLAEAVYSAVEFPSMMEVTTSDLAEGFFGIDLELCEEFYIANAMISAQLAEVIIAKPKAGCEEALNEQLDKHFDYIKNDPNATFYPAQEVSAAGAVSGVTAEGYHYIIVHENGADAAEAINAAE
ncbi:MAG: DUF4358 domain-containing protein [Oscillospiraceae bacterium]